MKISSGVGAGIIIDNRLFHGAGGTAGEIGHLTLDDQGPLCRCGSRGCLEAYTSTGTVQAMMAGQLPRADLDAIVAAAQSGNVGAQRALEDAGLHLGWGLASIVNLLNPAIVVVGGDMARAGELLLESARIGLRRHALDSVALTPVVASELGRAGQPGRRGAAGRGAHRAGRRARLRPPTDRRRTVCQPGGSEGWSAGQDDLDLEPLRALRGTARCAPRPRRGGSGRRTARASRATTTPRAAGPGWAGPRP